MVEIVLLMNAAIVSTVKDKSILASKSFLFVLFVVELISMQENVEFCIVYPCIHRVVKST